MSTQPAQPIPSAKSAAPPGKAAAAAKPPASHTASPATPARPTDEVLNSLLHVIERLADHALKAVPPEAAADAERFVELARSGEIPQPDSADIGVARVLRGLRLLNAHIEGRDEGPVEQRLTKTLGVVLSSEFLAAPARVPVLIAAVFAVLRTLMQSKFSEPGANAQVLIMDCTARCLDLAIELMRTLPNLRNPQEGDEAGLTRAPLALYAVGALGIAVRDADAHKDLAAIPGRVVVAAAHALCDELLSGGINGAQPGIAITSRDVTMSELRRFFLPRAHGDEAETLSLFSIASKGIAVPDVAIAALLQAGAELFGGMAGVRAPTGGAAPSSAPMTYLPIDMPQYARMEKEAAQLSADVRAEKDATARQKKMRTFWIDLLQGEFKRLQDAGKAGHLCDEEALVLQNLDAWFKENGDKLKKNDPKLRLPATMQLVYGKDALPTPGGQLSTLEDSLRKGAAEFNKTAKPPLSADAVDPLIAQVFRDIFVETLVPSAVTRLQQRLRVSLVALRPNEWPLWMSPSGHEKPKPWDLQAFHKASETLVVQLAGALGASDADRLRFATLVLGIMRGADSVVLDYEAAKPLWLHELNLLVALLLACAHLRFASGAPSAGGRPSLAPLAQWPKNATSIAAHLAEQAGALETAIKNKEKNLRRGMGLGPRSPTQRV